jgi:hypothetical protein
VESVNSHAFGGRPPPVIEVDAEENYGSLPKKMNTINEKNTSMMKSHEPSSGLLRLNTQMVGAGKRR